MQRLLKIVTMILLITIGVETPTSAQNPADAFIGVVTRVIKAIDLKIQRIQTQTIWLQNAQKQVETAMQQLHLDEISDWVKKSKDLYSDYFEELWKVKNIITLYYRIKDITNKQLQLVSAYKKSYQILQQDKHFTSSEVAFMGKVYEGILNESLKNIDQLFLVINSFDTQMSDSKRLAIINDAGDHIDKNYRDLQRFNNENFLLSIQRSVNEEDALTIKHLYGLQ